MSKVGYSASSYITAAGIRMFTGNASSPSPTTFHNCFFWPDCPHCGQPLPRQMVEATPEYKAWQASVDASRLAEESGKGKKQ